MDAFANANRYILTAALTINKDALITGAEQVRFTNHTTVALDKIVFRLYPNMQALGGSMSVSNITLNGKPIKPALTQTIMSVPLDTPLVPGAAAEMTMDFKVTMRAEYDSSYGRFGYKHGIVSAANWYPTLSVYDLGKGWWQDEAPAEGDPGYSESGLYDVHLTVPPQFVAAMSGTTVETLSNTDGTTTYHDVTGPMRDHIFLASDKYDHISQMVNGTTVQRVSL